MDWGILDGVVIVLLATVLFPIAWISYLEGTAAAR